MMGLSTSAMAQEVNYKDMLKPIETTLKAGNADPKEFAKTLKEYQKVFKKDPKALVALGNILAMNKQYDDANLVADGVIAKFKTMVMHTSSRVTFMLCRIMEARLLHGMVSV